MKNTKSKSCCCPDCKSNRIKKHTCLCHQVQKIIKNMPSCPSIFIPKKLFKLLLKEKGNGFKKFKK